MENLKDEQIKNQGETITSLERKVQSLESELQKCLDPDSGEINPAIRYHYRSGEDALRQQIEDMQKQLDDCLDTGHSIIRTKAIERMLEMACASPFMPQWFTNESGRAFYPKNEGWEFLQERMIASSELIHFWSDKSFKAALKHVTYINKKLAIHCIPNLVGKYEEVASDIGENCLCDKEDHDAFLLIKKMLDHIKASDLYCGDINHLLVQVTVIIKCQEIYLSCQEEPEPEEGEPENEAE